MDFSKVGLGVVFNVVFSNGDVQGMGRHIETSDESINVVSDEVDYVVEGSGCSFSSLLADGLLDHVESEVTADTFESK